MTAEKKQNAESQDQDGIGQCWLIAGASSSIARAFARQAASRGADILLAGRDLEDMQASAADLRARYGIRAEVLSFDALDTESVADLIRNTESQVEDRELCLFLAFALMPDQKDMEADSALALDCLQAGFAASVQLLLGLASRLEAQRGGQVIALGSVAGDRGRPSNYIYGSAKAGLHAFLQGYRARMFRQGVQVLTLKPGFVDTAMTWGLPGLFLVASPQRIAEKTWGLSKKGREVAYLPWFWLGIMTIIKSVPERIFKRLSL